jgi:hypothetical protein
MLRRGMATCVLVLCCAPGAVIADETRHYQIGISAEVLPIGELVLEVPGLSFTGDLETAFGISASFEYVVPPAFAIGFAPRFIFGIKGEDGTDSAQQLDLRARARVQTQVSRTTGFYAFVAPGYSILFVPDWPREVDRPAGFVLGFGGGVALTVGARGFVSFELGYQLGFQKVSEMGESADVKTNFFHLGFGGGTRF